MLPNITDQMLKDWMLEESIHQSGTKKGQLKCRSNNDKNRSAVRWLYGKFDVQLASTFHSKSKEFNKGRVKEIGKQKLEGTIDATQGKDVLTLVGYISLSAFSFAIYTVHLFLTYAWNLMMRSCNTAELRINHFSWGGDCTKVGWGGQHIQE